METLKEKTTQRGKLDSSATTRSKKDLDQRKKCKSWQKETCWKWSQELSRSSQPYGSSGAHSTGRDVPWTTTLATTYYLCRRRKGSPSPHNRPANDTVTTWPMKSRCILKPRCALIKLVFITAPPKSPAFFCRRSTPLLCPPVADGHGHGRAWLPCPELHFSIAAKLIFAEALAVCF